MKQIDLKTGDTVLYRTEFRWWKLISYLSWAIRRITGCTFNHSVSVIEVGGIMWLVEARGKGVIMRQAQWYLRRHASPFIVLRPAGEFNEGAYRTYLVNVIGAQYDVGSLLFFQLFYRITGWWWGPTGQKAANRVVCAELSAQAHNRPKWWQASCRELLMDPYFIVADGDMLQSL